MVYEKATNFTHNEIMGKNGVANKYRTHISTYPVHVVMLQRLHMSKSLQLSPCVLTKVGPTRKELIVNPQECDFNSR